MTTRFTLSRRFISAFLSLFPASFNFELGLPFRCGIPYVPTALGVFGFFDFANPSAAFMSPPQIRIFLAAMSFIHLIPFLHSHICVSGLALTGAYVDTTNKCTGLLFASTAMKSMPSHLPSLVHSCSGLFSPNVHVLLPALK